MAAIEHIFLDLDGVLGDWTTAAIEACGDDPAAVYAQWPEDVWDLAEAMGITGNAMWSAVGARGEALWAELAVYPWAHDLLCFCQQTAPTTILTSPSRDPASLAGKLRWLQKFTGDDAFADYLVGPAKTACARPGALLIDDRPKNVDAFTAAGGLGVLFPALWNELRPLASSPFAYTVGVLSGLQARGGES